MAQLNSLVVTGSTRLINETVASSRVTTQGPLIVRSTNAAGSYDEGIRINQGINGYSSLTFGGTQDSVSGTGDYQFWIGTNRTNASYQRKLIIAHNGSTASNTYFYANAAGTVSPYLNLGSSGTITSGNTQAVTGGVVYTALTNGTVTKVGTGTVGGTTTPIYLNAGTPTALSYTIAKSVPSNAVFTDTTYTVASGDANGQIKVTPSSGSAYNVNVKGLGSAAYTASTAYAAASHTHPINQVTWAGGQNLAPSASANNAEWSIDLTPGSYTGSYFHIYSAKNSKTIMAWYTDTNEVTVPNGNLKVTGGKTYNRVLADMLTGTGTAAQDKGSGVSPRYFPAKWTFNIGIATPADGDIVTIKIPVVGHDFGTFLSLDNGTTYKPISVDYGTGRLTTHYAVNRPITLIYDSSGQTNSVFAAAGADARSNITGGCWRVMNFWDSGNTYDRNRYNCNIKAWGTKILNANIVVGIDGLYHHLKEGTAFDITYPILYLAGDCNANATTTNTYDMIHFTSTTTQNTSWTAYKPVYIKGILRGTIFTPVSTTPLTQAVPTSDDGYWYVLLGNATSTTTIYLQEVHPIYTFVGGQFQEAPENSGIRLSGAASATMTYASTNPQISFSENGAQGVKILYTDYDSYRAPYGLKVIGDNSAGAAWFEVEGSIFCNGGKYNSYFTATPTSGQVVVTDGTAGGVKTTGYTIAKSVPSNANFENTLNTAGSTDTSSKIFLIGATSQAANPQTYSDNEVYATSGILTTKSVQVGGTSATMQYNSTNHAIEFIVA